MADFAVRVDGLWKAYRRRSRWGWRTGGPHWALQNIDLEVAPGAMLGVIGGNGSGKTTLLQVLAGVLGPTRGEVHTVGRVASLVDLTAGFHRDLTGHENLLVGGVLLGVGRRELEHRYDDIVAFSGLDRSALDQPLASYSAGMGLRLGFSLVVSARPDVLLVDEVLAVGDEAFRDRCITRVRQLRHDGCAVVLVSHDMPLVRQECDRVALLQRGEVEALGPPDDVVDRYVAAAARQVAPAPDVGRLFESSARVGRARRRRGV